MPAIFEKYRRLPAPIYILTLVRPIAFALALSGAALLYALSLREPGSLPKSKQLPV